MLDWLEALKLALVPSVLLSNFIGTAVGIVIGALPGLTSTMGVALAVPLTYGMAPASGFAMLCGIYCGSVYGGAITAILINTPGTPAGAATTLDGYPMAQKGRAVEALGIAVISSFIGGLFSVAVLSFCAPVLARVALSFGPAEYFAVMVFGTTIISSISGKSMSRGLFAGLLGMFLGTFGTDPLTGYPRFADGVPGLYGGIEIVPCLIGLFSFPQAIDMVVKKVKESRMNARAIAYEKPLEEIANKLMRRREPQRRKVSSSQESLPAVEYKETPKTPQNPDRRHENEPDISGTAGRDRGLPHRQRNPLSTPGYPSGQRAGRDL